MYRSKNIQRFPTVTNEELPVEKRVRDDDQQRIGGVYRVSTRNGEIAHYSTSWDLQRAKSHNLRQLVLGKHAHHWLQQEYDTTALRGIRFEIVEVVKRPKRKLVLPNIGDIKSDWREGRGRHRGTRKWSHRGRDQVSGNSSAWVGGLPPPLTLAVDGAGADNLDIVCVVRHDGRLPARAERNNAVFAPTCRHDDLATNSKSSPTRRAARTDAARVSTDEPAALGPGL